MPEISIAPCRRLHIETYFGFSGIFRWFFIGPNPIPRPPGAPIRMGWLGRVPFGCLRAIKTPAGRLCAQWRRGFGRGPTGRVSPDARCRTPAPDSAGRAAARAGGGCGALKTGRDSEAALAAPGSYLINRK